MDHAVTLLKFADDTTVTGVIKDADGSAYRHEELLVQSQQAVTEHTHKQNCSADGGFQEVPPVLPSLTILHKTVIAVKTFKFLGTPVSQQIKWEPNIIYIAKKSQLRKFDLPQEVFPSSTQPLCLSLPPQ